MKLPFAPACAALLLGSLPHTNASLALTLSQRYASEIVAWPQLWERGMREQLLPQSVAGFPGLVYDEERYQVFVDQTNAQNQLEQLELAYLQGSTGFAAMTDREAVGLFEVLHQSDRLGGVRAVKGQLLGPISTAMQLTDEHQKPLIYNPMLFDAVAQFVRLRMAWQLKQLQQLGKPTIMCVDEPFLEMVDSPFVPIDWDEAGTQIALALTDVPGCRAICAVGSIDWGHLLRIGLDMVIGDVYNYSPLLLGAAESLATFVAAGGHVGLGLVPADSDVLAHTSAEQLVAKLDKILAELDRADVDTAALLRQAVLTPSGPLGALSVADAERALELLADCVQLVREHHGLLPNNPKTASAAHTSALKTSASHRHGEAATDEQ